MMEYTQHSLSLSAVLAMKYAIPIRNNQYAYFVYIMRISNLTATVYHCSLLSSLTNTVKMP